VSGPVGTIPVSGTAGAGDGFTPNEGADKWADRETGALPGLLSRPEKYSFKDQKPVDSVVLCLNRAEKPIIILFIRGLCPRRMWLDHNFIYISFKIIIIG